MRKLALLLTTLALVACDSTPASDYDYLEGTFVGTARGTPRELVAATTIEVVTQVEGDLSGTWALTGLVDEVVPVSMSATFEGTVGKGRDPAVSFSLEDGCGRVSGISGEYETSRQRLVLSGDDVVVSGLTCDVAFRLAVDVEATKQSGS